MRSKRLIFAVVIAGLTILSMNASALEPPLSLSRSLHPIDGPADAGDHSGVVTASDACPATNVGTLTDGSTIVGSTIGSTDDFVAGCGSQPGGQDEIFEFSVDIPTLWIFDTCTVTACWDTTLEIREETGGGCPGDFVACDGDACNVCYYESALLTFLIPSSTYYLIVDGWSTFAYGDFEITVSYFNPVCVDDAGCDDGVFCNGAETCVLSTAQCLGGSPPCTTYEGYTNICDEGLGRCVKADDCFTWIAGPGSGYFFPESNHCSDLASWVFDDVQGSHHTTGVLDFYTTPLLARSTPAGASPLGTVFSVDQALFTVAGTCCPEELIPGTQCTGTATVDPGGSPAHDLPCSPPSMPLLPNNSGDFSVCEIDFFLAYRTTENGAGFMIAASKPALGGPAGADDFGVSIIALEDCPPTGSYCVVTSFGDDDGVQADFATAVVCQKPGGSCCHPDGSCSQTSEADCDGIFGFTGTTNGTDGGCGDDPDSDGVYSGCFDNCPNTPNSSQEDCDGDGEGDACEADAADQDGDGDGVCNGVDNCPDSVNQDQLDSDGDGKGDVCDPCPFSAPDDADGDGVCGDVDKCEGWDDNDDTDNDGFPGNGDCHLGSCDCCEDSDDGAAGALGDADGDGVLNCNDLCPDVDDAVFAPECDGAIPTTSQWGLIVLTLLLLAGGKIYFRGRGAVPTSLEYQHRPDYNRD